MKCVKCLIIFTLSIIIMFSSVLFASAEELPNDDDWQWRVFENESVDAIITENTLDPKCKTAILIEAETGTVLYEKNADKRVPIASVTKIMTLLLAMEAIDNNVISMSDIITISETAASMGGSQAYMEVGEQLSMEEILKSVVVASANDGAVALAEHISGSIGAFVELMNQKATSLGMTNTLFLNPTGLDDAQDPYSSARDVAIMSRELLKYPLILNYTTIWTDSIRNGKFSLANTNKLIRFYPNANGLKTGSTSKAKYCLSASAKRNDMQLISVILGADSSNDRFSGAKSLLDYGFATYAFYSPEKYTPDKIRVWGGTAQYITPKLDLNGLLTNKSDINKITTKVELETDLIAPVDKNQVVGKYTFYLGDEILKEIPIFANESVEKATLWDIFRSLLKLFFCQK